MMNPGEIEFPERHSQVISVEGMVYSRGISPTDIDAFIDFGGKVFVYVEAKLRDMLMKAGQQTALYRLCSMSPVMSFVIVCEHNTRANEIIVLHKCVVREVICNRVSFATPRANFWETICAGDTVGDVVKKIETEVYLPMEEKPNTERKAP